MSKKPTKQRRARRPKSVYAKGWATRKRNQALKTLLDMGSHLDEEAVVKGMAKAAGWNPVTVAEASQMGTVNQETPPRSDAVISLLNIHRDEQLSGFMADMQCMRRMGMPAHAPIMVSRSQIEAIEYLLGELGYSMFGNKPA